MWEHKPGLVAGCGEVCKGPRRPWPDLQNSRRLDAVFRMLVQDHAGSGAELLSVEGTRSDCWCQRHVTLVAANFIEHLLHARSFPDASVILIFHMRKLRHGEVRRLARSHRAAAWRPLPMAGQSGSIKLSSV